MKVARFSTFFQYVLYNFQGLYMAKFKHTIHLIEIYKIKSISNFVHFDQ